MVPTIAAVMISLGTSEIGAAALSDTVGLPERRGIPPVHAQSGTIAGRVFSEGWPVEFAFVWTRERVSIKTQSDSCGWFVLSGVPIGKRTLYVGAIGHSRATAEVDVAEGETDTVRVDLEPGRWDRHPACDPHFEITYYQGDQPPIRVRPGALLCGNVYLDVIDRPATTTTGWGSLSVSRHRMQCTVPVSWTHHGLGEARLVVRDEDGAVVRMLARASEPQGSALWDGTRDGGDPAPSGKYVVRLESGRRHLQLEVWRVVQTRRDCSE